MAKIEWTFNGKDMIDGGAATPFSFRLERYKDSSTYEESLKIFSVVNDKDNGFIVTTIYNLEKEIEQLMKYGVILSPIEFKDLHKVIKANYLNLVSVPVSLAKDSRFDELITSVKEYVNGNADLITKDFCYVPVAEFNTLVEDCGFYEYEMKALRRQLKDEGYIRTEGNRYAIPKRIKDKVARVIAFKRDKIGVAVPVSKKDKQSKKSDADEK